MTFASIQGFKKINSNGDGIAIHGKDTDLLVRFYEAEEVFYKDKDPTKPEMEVGDVLKVKTEFCEMQFPGDNLKKVVKRVKENPHLIERFPAQYEAFKRGEEFKKTGHLLAATDFFSDQQIKDLSNKHIHTVEQFISTPDIHLRDVLGGFQLKRKCSEWLETAKKRSETETKEDVNELKRKVEELTALLSQQKDGEAPRRGRPPKSETNETQGV